MRGRDRERRESGGDAEGDAAADPRNGEAPILSRPVGLLARS